MCISTGRVAFIFAFVFAFCFGSGRTNRLACRRYSTVIRFMSGQNCYSLVLQGRTVLQETINRHNRTRTCMPDRNSLILVGQTVVHGMNHRPVVCTCGPGCFPPVLVGRDHRLKACNLGLSLLFSGHCAGPSCR